MNEKLKYTKLEGKPYDFLNKYFRHKYCRGYIKWENFMLREHYQNFGDRILNLDVRPDDIWLCSFMKTGSSWSQEMIWCVANECDWERAKVVYHKRVTFLESISVLDVGLEERKKTGYYPIDSISSVEESPSPRFIKTHLPFPLLPKKLQENSTAKIIYTTRNPADTCISYHDFASWDMGYTGTFDEFCKLFLEGLVPYGPFWDHVLSYWQKKANSNILILKYEDMKKDLKSVICEVAKFLGKTLSDYQIEKLCEHLSFDNMKQNPAVNREGLQERAQYLQLGNRVGEFIRVGKVGEWKRIMKPEIQKRFQILTDEKFTSAGLTFE